MSCRENYQVVPNLTKDLSEWEFIGQKEIPFFKQPNRYRVYKNDYKHATKDHVWSIAVIEVFRDGEKLCEFIRNYPSFTGIFVTQDGKDFLVTSADYQCITIVDLENGNVTSFVDIDDYAHGCGFCPIYFDWDEGTLYIEGCIWACPEETMVCRDIDLNNPIEAFNNAEWQSDYEDAEYDDWDEEDNDYNDDDADCYSDD